MTTILVSSLVLRLIAIGLTIAMALRLRDWRMLLLTALLVVTVLGPVMTLFGASGFAPGTGDGTWRALLGLVVSLTSIPAVYYLGQIIDENRRNLAALRAGQVQLRASIECTPNVGVQWFDEQGRVVYWNPASETIYGWSAEDAVGKTLDTLFLSSVDAAEFREMLKKIRETGGSIGPREFRFKRRDGGTGDCLATLFSIPNPSGGQAYACMNVDVTARKRAEDEAQHRETQLRMFVEHCPAAVAMLDRDMRYIVASRRWMEDYRLEGHNLVGRSHYEVFPEVPDRWKQIHARCLTGVILRSDEDCFVRQDGSVDWLRWEIHPWRRADDTVGGLILFTEVITQRKQAAEAVRRAEARYRSLVDNLNVVAWEADIEMHRFTFIGGQPEKITGFSVEEWQKPGYWINRIHPEDREPTLAHCRQMIALCQDYDIEYRFIREDGGIVWVHDYVSIEMVDGRPVTLRGLMLDVTESKASRAQLEETQERLRTTIEAAQLGFWEMQTDTRSLTLSPEWYRLLGYNERDFPSAIEASHQLFHPEDEQSVIDYFNQFAANPDKPFECEFRMRHRDGEYRWLLSRGFAARKKNGRAILVRGVNFDVTEQRKVADALRESEGRFRGIADHGSVGIWQISTERKTLYANAAMCRLLEVDSLETLRQHKLEDFFPPEMLSTLQRQLDVRFAGRAATFEVELIGKKGTRRHVIICGVPMFDASGKIVSSIGTFTDITAQKRAEFNLIESQQRLEGIVKSAMDGIITVDDSHRIVLYNSAAEQMFQCREADALGRHIEDFIPERYRATHAESIRRFGKTGVTTRRMGALGRVSGLRMNGEEFPIEASISQMDVAGRQYYTVILRDISERLRQENELRESRELLERAQDVGQIGSWWSDPEVEGSLRWSPQCHRIFGVPKEEFDERVETFFELVHPDDRELVRQESLAAVRGEKRYSIDHRIIRPDGTLCWVHEEADVVRDSDGRPLQMIGVCQDITARKLAEEAITEREERYRALVSAMSTVVWTADPEGRFTSPQIAWEIYTGQTPEQHQNYGWLDAIHPEDRDRVQSVWRGGIAAKTTCETDGRIWNAETQTYRYFSARGVPLKNPDGSVREWVGTVTDIDDRKRAEQAVLAAKQALLDQQRREKQAVEAELEKVRDQLVLKTRLATIGQVSASIAHELRNPLGAVRNAAYFLKRRAGVRDEKLTQYLTIIEQEVETSDRIISNLMEMTRAKEPEKQLVDLGETLDWVERSTAGLGAIQLTRDFEPSPFVVTADRGQLRQVFSNLVLNAVQSLKGQGVIRIDARRTDDDDIIILSDNGEGVLPENRMHLFEPLFTTKAKGTGLGLTICRQIIEQHGGSIEYVEMDAPGAAFRIRLPRKAQSA